MSVKSWIFCLAFFHVVLAGSCSVVQGDNDEIARQRANDKDKGPSNGQCHLEIKCVDGSSSPVQLPIAGPQGPPGPPGVPMARGDPGLPVEPSQPERLVVEHSFIEDGGADNDVAGFSISRERRSAFCVGLKENFGPVNENTDIIFDRVLTNVGGDYNAVTGRYTAPVNGTYDFKATISARGKQKAGAMLVKNGFMIAALWAESIPTWAAASNALILELKQGDQVWLMLLHKASHLHGYMYTTFTGNLLFRTGS